MKIIHNKEQQKFFLEKDGKEAYVIYFMQDAKTINIVRTYVPPEMRNQGLAGKVVKAALEYAKKNSLKIITTCSYANYFIDLNKEYEDLLV